MVKLSPIISVHDAGQVHLLICSIRSIRLSLEGKGMIIVKLATLHFHILKSRKCCCENLESPKIVIASVFVIGMFEDIQMRQLV